MSRQTVLGSIVTALLIIPNGRADFSPVPQELEVAEIIQKTRRHGRVCRLGALFEACLWREGERMRNANTFQNQVTMRMAYGI